MELGGEFPPRPLSLRWDECRIQRKPGPSRLDYSAVHISLEEVA